MNVSNSTLRRRQSVNPINRPLRRGPSFKKKRSTAAKQASNNDTVAISNQNRTINNNIDKSSSNNARTPSSKILDGVVACLSGQTEDVKTHIHNIIHKLGGACQGNFDAKYVTHLILDEPVGSKYDFYSLHLNSNYEWADKLHVVTTSWVECCDREGRRLSEEEYKLQDKIIDANNNNEDVKNTTYNKHTYNAEQEEEEQYTLPKEIKQISLEEKCNWMIQHQPTDKYCNLFSCQSFLLVGFDNDKEEGKNNNATTTTTVDGGDYRPVLRHDTSQSRSKSAEALKGKISKLIRRAGGTIFWEPNEWITTVLLNDNYTKHTWDDVRYFCREHPRGPICVSIDWILVSIFHNAIIVPPFPPEPQQILKRKARGSNGSVSSNNTSVATKKSKLKRKSKQSTTTSSIFRGDVFAVVPLKTVPIGTLDFSSEDMEATIVSHGGMLLTKTLLLAIKSDAKKSIGTSDSERKYYVVAPRLIPLDSASPYPLVSELTRIPGIKVVLVNKVWISACVMDDRVYDPTDFPLLFQPQTWSIRLLQQPSSASSSSSLVKVKSNKFLISVTGFVDSSRYGITSMLKEIGAEFTDTLSRKNTHLICKQAEGKKYTKALEWGLHVVSIDWLYHIIRYGFDEGSEDRFSLTARRKHPVEIKQQPATFAKNEEVRPLLNGKAAKEDNALLNVEGSTKDTHLDDTKLKDCNGTLNISIAELEENRKDIKEEVDTKPVQENSPSSQKSSSSHRGKRDPPQASPNPIQRTTQKESEDNPSKRLKFAMKELSGPSQASPQKKRRGKRDKSPKPSPQESMSHQPVGEEEESEEYSPQNETQFTVGTILANADIMNARNEPQMPLSALSHVEDNGESQLIWFAGSRR